MRRGNMAASAFEKLIHKLNPRLVCVRKRGHDGTDKSSVYMWEPQFDVNGLMDYRCQGNWKDICRVHPDWMPERTIFQTNGMIYRRGWREALSLLERQRLLRIPKEFGGGEKNGVLRYGMCQRINERNKLEPDVMKTYEFLAKTKENSQFLSL